MNLILMSKQQMANIASEILGQTDEDINEVLKAKILYKEFYGKEPELTFIWGCNCMIDYCDTPFSHGIRLDNLTIKEIRELIA